MIRTKHLLPFTVGEATMSYILIDAQSKCIGGASRVRSGEQRSENLLLDQMIGLVGTYVFTAMIFGGRDLYDEHMALTRNSLVGDGGTDVLGARIDVKTSLMRQSKDPMRYNLVVRPEEFHNHTAYVLVLLSGLSKTISKGYVVGWMDSWEIPENSTQDSRFGNAAVVRADRLHPVMPMRWKREG